MTPHDLDQVARALFRKHNPAVSSRTGAVIHPGYNVAEGADGAARIAHRVPTPDLLDENRQSSREIAEEKTRMVAAYTQTLTDAGWAVEQRKTSHGPFLLARQPDTQAESPTSTPVMKHTRDEHEEWFRIHLDGQTIGYADVETLRSGLVWISEIGVHPDHRGNGLASRLLAAVIERHGDSDIALSCDTFNPPFEDWPKTPGLPNDALATWYARHGFHQDQDQDDDKHRMIRHA